jgi:hypothetical protein
VALYAARVLAITLRLDAPVSFLDRPGPRAGFIVLGAFVLSFLFIRTSARLIRSPRVTWWPGSVKTGSGLHLHHLVWGIVLALLSGFLVFATDPSSPWDDVLAALFGVGAGLTLDEFALWIHLSDVYWSPQGRSSLEAVAIATALGGLVVLGAAPFDLPRHGASVATLALLVLSSLLPAVVAIVKGKPLLGVVGVFVPLVSLLAAVRLAAPGSVWARRFYPAGSQKAGRAQLRFERLGVRRARLGNLIGGAPDPAPPAPR